MSTVYELVKDRTTYYAHAKQTVLEVAQLMTARDIGAVPVMRGTELVGIFSERDVMKRVVAAALNPATTSVEDVMTANPVVIRSEESVENCLTLMRRHGFRHLPICDGEDLKGLISLRDILLRDLTEKDDEVKQMRAYLQQQS